MIGDISVAQNSEEARKVLSVLDARGDGKSGAN